MKNKEKEKIKRKISVFTIMLWIALIATMTVVTINGISRSNALEGNTRTITLKIDFSEYLTNENYKYYESFLEEYVYEIILTKSKNLDDYHEVKVDYLGSENDSIGIYEIEVPEEAKYYILDYDNSWIRDYYNLVNSNQTVEEILYYNEIYHGFKIENDLDEYNIKLVEKERKSVRVKIDFSEDLVNENIEDEDEINEFLKDKKYRFISLYENIINRPSEYNTDLYNKYRGNEENKIGIYDVEVPEGAKYIALEEYNNDYNLVGENHIIEEVKDNYNNKIYNGIKIKDGIEEYNVKLVEKEKRTVRIKIDFEEYLRAENIEDEYDIEEFFKEVKEKFIAINSDVINESDDYNTSLFNKYRGSEENKIGIYDVEVPDEAKYIALNLDSIYYDILSNDKEIIKIKNNYREDIYYGIRISEVLEECNIKITEKEKRTIRVKVDFSEYLANENIEDEDEIERILNNYNEKFFISNTNCINYDYGKYYTDLIYQYIGSEDNSIGIYDVSFLSELEVNYLGVYKDTNGNPKYYITNDDNLVQYIYGIDIYYGQKMEEYINEYKFKLKVNNVKTLNLDISEVSDLIEFDEYNINLEINNNVFYTAELIELNDNLATFNIYAPKNTDFDIVFDNNYKVLENDVELEKYNEENGKKYYKRIEADKIGDIYNFKLSKRYVEVNVKINGIDNITEEIDERFKNLNIEVRNTNNEILDKMYYLSNSSNEYKYISNKIYSELEFEGIYIELDDLKQYSIVEHYEKIFDENKASYEFYEYDSMTYNNYNIEKNKWEHMEEVKAEISYTINYKEKLEDGKNEKIIEFSKDLGDNIPKELYENIIIFHKGSKWIFDRMEGKQYIYKIVATDFPYDTDEYDIYIPKILDNNIKAKLENVKYLSVNNVTIFNSSYIILGNEIDFGDNIIIQNYDENSGIYKDIEFLDSNNARLNFSYIAIGCIGKYIKTALHRDKYYSSYISENGNGYNNFEYKIGDNDDITNLSGGSSKSFILFKENLPKDFKVSDEYINNDEWVFLDNISDEEYYLPDCNSNGLSLNKDVMNELIEKLNLDNISANYLEYTDKKYVYVKSTNTLYYLVDKIGISGIQSINIEYIGNEDIEKKYIVNNNVDAYYVVVERYIRGESHDVYKSYINKYNLTEVDVEKRWEDNNNINNVRPDSIIAELKKNGDTVKEKKLSSLNNWKGKIYYVPKYDYKIVKDKDGKNIVEERKIEYTIDEKVVSPYYEKEIVGNVITNRYIDKGEYKNLDVNKKWIDENNKYNMRPESIIIQVYDKDKLVAEEVVSEENNWKCSFKLPKYDESGNKIEYRIDEKERKDGELKYYDKKIDGNSIINTLNYKEKVDTGDINIFLYIGILVVATIIFLVVIIFIRKKLI